MLEYLLHITIGLPTDQIGLHPYSYPLGSSCLRFTKP